jgi:hypothetical protein
MSSPFAQKRIAEAILSYINSYLDCRAAQKKYVSKADVRLAARMPVAFLN